VSKLGPHGTSAGNWPIVPAPGDRAIVRMDNLVELRLAGEIGVLRENLSQRHFVHHKSQLTIPGLEPGPPLCEASD
jgi:hypothetical protein